MLKSYRFDYIKQLIDTEEYISRFVDLKKAGKIYKGRCPFHSEKTPSFVMYPSSNTDGKHNHASFYCFGCGATGDLFEFRKRWENLNNKWEALELFEKEMGVDLDEEQTIENHLKNKINQINEMNNNLLSLSEINLICSIMCRNYLLWVKENYYSKYIEESFVVDKYYLYFDNYFDEHSAEESIDLIDEVEKKLEKRRKKIMFEKLEV